MSRCLRADQFHRWMVRKAVVHILVELELNDILEWPAATRAKQKSGYSRAKILQGGGIGIGALT